MVLSLDKRKFVNIDLFFCFWLIITVDFDQNVNYTATTI